MLIKLFFRSFRFNYKHLILVCLSGLLLLRLLLFIRYDIWGILKRGGGAWNDDGEKNILVISTANLSSNCPLCLDSRLCGEEVRVTWEKQQIYEELFLREGRLGSKDVSILSASSDIWNRLEESVCRNVTRHAGCGPQQAAVLSYLATVDPYGLVTNSSSLLLTCPTPRLKKRLQAAYDRDLSGSLEPTERISMATAMLTMPVFLTLKVFPHSSLPTLLGACHRWIYLTPPGLPLDHFHSASASIRIRLALNLIQALYDLEAGSQGWSFFFTRLRSSDIRVDPSTLKPTFLNLQDLLAVDKAAMASGRSVYKATGVPSSVCAENVAQLRGAELCNEICFQRFTEDILYGPGQGCSLLPYHAQLMFALMCKEVLSPLPEHHSPGFFNYDGHRLALASPRFPGLLGELPPGPPGDGVEEYLRECVLETLPGGRRNALTLLRQVLEDFLIE